MFVAAVQWRGRRRNEKEEKEEGKKKGASRQTNRLTCRKERSRELEEDARKKQ